VPGRVSVPAILVLVLVLYHWLLQECSIMLPLLTCVLFDALPQVDLSRINALIAQNAGLKAMLEEEHLQLEVGAESCVMHAACSNPNLAVP